MEYANPPAVILKQIGAVAFGSWQRRGVKEWLRTSLDGSLIERLWHGGTLTQLADGSWETTKQEGFGSRTFTLDHVEGLGKVHLRGPWFGGDLDGYQEQSMVDMTGSAPSYYAGKAWHARTACFGWYIRQTDLIAILSRYVPHMPIAREKRFSDWCSTVHPYLEEWGMPKDFFIRLPRAA
jgi:hypothetical protein